MNYTHIHDGYTRKAFVNGLNEAGQRLTGELRFTYRPMLAVQREAVRNLMDTAKGEKLDLLFASAIAKQLVDWTAARENEDGSTSSVPPTVENVRRLPPFLYDRLYRIIAGIEPGDPEPEPEPTDDAYSAELQQALDSGQPFGDCALAARQKN